MLDARQLQALSAVMEHGSFSAAASALSLTLSAVSLRIKQLEAALGQRVLVRGKTVRATPAGQRLLAHTRQLRLMEAELLGGLRGESILAGSSAVPEPPVRLQRLSVAVNADSLASWFLPGVAESLQKHHLLLDTVIDDQDHTHDALANGDVTGCITTLSQAMRGCVAEPLGRMRYHCMAAPLLVARWREAGLPHAMLRSPAVIFNRKDALQDAFLALHFGLKNVLYPRHFMPAVDAFELALELGLGWGMVPSLLLELRPENRRNLLCDVMPGCTIDVMLYWQRWQREPAAAQRLSQAIRQAASAKLLPAEAEPAT